MKKIPRRFKVIVTGINLKKNVWLIPGGAFTEALWFIDPIMNSYGYVRMRRKKPSSDTMELHYCLKRGDHYAFSDKCTVVIVNLTPHKKRKIDTTLD